jgi:ubiquinone/menaquinone biosynthesis C-methylase UbiE
MNNLAFAMTALWFGLRDLFSSPRDVLREVDIRPGFQVLDYGCGPGSYSIAAAELVGQSGKTYAADISPLALQSTQSVAARKGLSNVSTIQTDCATGLGDSQVDVVLLYDAYHDLVEPGRVLRELHRILKPAGVLSFSDHHMRDEQIMAEIVGKGLFRLLKKNKKTYSFLREGDRQPKPKTGEARIGVDRACQTQEQRKVPLAPTLARSSRPRG